MPRPETTEKIVAAAEALLAETGVTPTLSAVRERAGAGTAATHAVFRDWLAKQEQKPAVEPEPLPEALQEVISRLQTAVDAVGPRAWATARHLSAAGLDAATAAWKAERAELTTQIDQMVAESEEQTELLTQTTSERDQARQEAAKAAQDLVRAQVRADTLAEQLAALTAAVQQARSTESA